MTLLTISQAAQRIGTDEQTICRWIEAGLLTPQRILVPQRQAKRGVPVHSSTPGYAIPVDSVLIDAEEIDEIAELEGWLLIASESLQREETDRRAVRWMGLTSEERLLQAALQKENYRASRGTSEGLVGWNA